MDGYSYDAAGNLLNDGVHQYSYDAEGRITTVDGGSSSAYAYVYDAEGVRVETRTPSSGNLYYIHTLDGQVMYEVSDYHGGGRVRGEIYAGRRHLGSYSNSTLFYAHADWLGTERARTVPSGSLFMTCTSLPFGDAMWCNNSDWTPARFTGKEQDSESGLDNFGARYYSSSFGRWLSADWSAVPVPVPYANLTNPQTINLYAMVADNPESFADLDGHAPASYQVGVARRLGPGHDVGKRLLDKWRERRNFPRRQSSPGHPPSSPAAGAKSSAGVRRWSARA